MNRDRSDAEDLAKLDRLMALLPTRAVVTQPTSRSGLRCRRVLVTCAGAMVVIAMGAVLLSRGPGSPPSEASLAVPTAAAGAVPTDERILPAAVPSDSENGMEAEADAPEAQAPGSAPQSIRGPRRIAQRPPGGQVGPAPRPVEKGDGPADEPDLGQFFALGPPSEPPLPGRYAIDTSTITTEDGSVVTATTARNTTTGAELQYIVEHTLGGTSERRPSRPTEASPFVPPGAAGEVGLPDVRSSTPREGVSFS